jgi:hypothetical protein
MASEPETHPRPDIIVRYPSEENGFASGGEEISYAVAYVRPETNNVLYERAIASALRACADTLYMANLNGALLLQDRILEEHYASQFRFARDPRGIMSGYPQIVSRFEDRFRVSFADAPLIGSFDAVQRLGVDEEQLFETIVPEAHFLDCWGQEFKRIADAIVVNPNLPAIVKRYTPRANVLVIAVRSRGTCEDFFSTVNRSIYSAIVSHHDTPVLDGERLESLPWSEKIRRTYHLSTNHLMAMIDMADFIYLGDGKRLAVEDTPLGRMLLAAGVLSRQRLASLKVSQLAYLGAAESDGGLVYLPSAGAGKSRAEICGMLRGA